MLVNIEVTENDILMGEAGDCWRCPVAIALGRLLNRYYYCAVGDEILIGTFSSASESHTIISPRKVLDFINAFDNGGGHTPFWFELDLPEKVLKETQSVN